MKTARLPSWRDSRVLIQTLFDPFSLAPVDLEWLEKKYGAPKVKTGPREQAINSDVEPLPVGRPKKKSVSDPQQRRKEHEDKADGKFTTQEWEQVKSTHDSRCLRCGAKESQIVPDHIHPLYRGGSGLIGNIQPLCNKCNIWKGLRIIDYRPGFPFEVI